MPTAEEDAHWTADGPIWTPPKVIERLPDAPESEQYLCSVLFVFPDAASDVFASGVSHTDIVSPHLREIYRLSHRQHLSGGLNPPTLVAELNETNVFRGERNAAGMLVELRVGDEAAVTRAHIAHHAQRILEESSRRRQLESIDAWRAAIVDKSCSPFDALEVGKSEIWELERHHQFGRPQARFTFSELSRLYPSLREPVIEGLARQGETINIISHTKVGKSWFGYLLALHLILGLRFLDRFQTKPGKVLIIDNELHEETLAYRIREVANALAIEPEEYSRDLEIWPLRGKRKNLWEISDELLQIDRGEFGLILWDSKYRVERPGKSENSNDDEKEFYNVIDEIGEHSLAVQGLIHHATKGNQSDRRTTDIGAGGGAQSRAADSHLVLREHQSTDSVVLDAAIRSFAPIEPMVLKWQFPIWKPDHAADPNQLKRQPSAAQQRQQSADRDGLDITIKALRGGPATARKLRGKTGFGEYRQQRMLDLLSSQGHVTVIEDGKNHVEYQLSE